MKGEVAVGIGETLQFCVNEPKLWVLTIFKVPGYSDASNHQYLCSFASKFGVVHMIHHKTMISHGKSFGSSNIIAQYSSLFLLLPKIILLDCKQNLEVYRTKPKT